MQGQSVGLPSKTTSSFRAGDMKFMSPYCPIMFDDEGGTWLKTGNFSTWSSRYQRLLKNNKGFCVRDLPTAVACPFTSYSSGNNIYYQGGNYYYVGGNGSSGGSEAGQGADLSFSGTSLSAGLTAITFASCSMMMGTVITVGGSPNGGIIGVASSASGAAFAAVTGVPVSTNIANMVSNTAGTLGLCIPLGGVSNGAIYTTTNGSAFTSRVGAGGTSGFINGTYWSPCAAAFLFVGSNFINKTTDGYTQTACSIPAGFTFTSSDSWKLRAASSSTSTVIIMTDGRLLRTTDGVNFTIIDPVAFGALPIGTGAAKASWDGSRYVIFVRRTASGSPTFLCSDDDGVTWYDSLAYEDVSLSSAAYVNVLSLSFVNGKQIASCSISGGSTVTRTYDLTGIVGRSVQPTKVGLAVQAGNGGTTFPLTGYIKVAS